MVNCSLRAVGLVFLEPGSRFALTPLGLILYKETRHQPRVVLQFSSVVLELSLVVFSVVGL